MKNPTQQDKNRAVALTTAIVLMVLLSAAWFLVGAIIRPDWLSF